MIGQRLGSTMRVLRPAANLLAFYDGRIAGVRAWSAAPNWLDDGAFALGACSYAIVESGEAIVYDTHMSLDHAAIVRRTLEEAGVQSIRVVLSHWHADHVAGNGVFADCEIIANALTARIMQDRRAELEGDEPPITPLVLPTRTFETALALKVGGTQVELHHFDIHSRDGTVAWLPASGTLLAGDTLEDPITYVTEPERLAVHLRDLDRMALLPIARILPNHGEPAVIAAGGYGPALLQANRRYVAKLLRCREDATLAGQDLHAFIGDDLAAGNVIDFAPYAAVHARNVRCVLSEAVDA